VDQTIQIIRGLRDKYEAHHGAKYADDAIVAAVKLADRYINDRFPSDKAIDVIDEAGASARLSISAIPTEVRVAGEAGRGGGQGEGGRHPASRSSKRRRASVTRRKTSSEAAASNKKTWTESSTRRKRSWTSSLIAKVISRMTGIPIARLEEKEQEKLLRMEEEIRKSIVGQEEAVAAVSRAIRRKPRRSARFRAGRSGPSYSWARPGVGKTELARVLARFLFDDPDALIRDRHVGIHGKILGFPTHRRPAGVCGA